MTAVVLDLNGLKTINDTSGHATGDALLRRAGEVLAKAVDKSICAARIGGDEFALLLPGTDEAGARQVVDQLQKLVDLNNQFYGNPALSFAIGVATCRAGGRLEEVVHHADERMYDQKRAYYRAAGMERRRF